METTNNIQAYKSLTEIRARKDALLTDLQKDNKQIKSLWTDLFHKPVALSSTTPSKRISGLINTGAGLLDCILLGWKLYRKFNNSNILSTKKKR